jgi:hypothetical protein
MELRKRTEQTSETRQGQPGDGAASSLQNLQAEGRNLLDAADNAIRAALSDNSLDFLNNVRQTGGE